MAGADMTLDQSQFLDLLSQMNQEKNLAIFCRDTIDADVTAEHKHCQQAQRFLQTAKQDARQATKSNPDGFEYVLLALIAKDMLQRCPNSGLADMMTGITLVFRSLTPIPIDEVGLTYRQELNCSVYNMRNKLLSDYFHNRGIWLLVNNKVAANKQYDKIANIKKEVQFRVDEPPRHDVYLIKTTNFVRTSKMMSLVSQAKELCLIWSYDGSTSSSKANWDTESAREREQSVLSKIEYAPSHYILLINKYCFHITNVGLFSGEYKRMKSRLFRDISSFDKVGTTTMDVIEIDHACQVLAAQSHSLLFNNCQNYATNVYNTICEEKGVIVEFSSFSGARVIIQVLMIVILALVMALLIALYASRQ